MTDATYDYEGIKALAKELGRSVETLIAQSPQSDPFYADRPGRREAAEWFAGLWGRFDFPRGVHLRRIHYALISQREPVEMAEGKPYENTFECWQKLCVASRDARHLELVPADWWSDKKSTALIHLVEPAAAEVTLEEGELSAMTDMPEPPRLELIPPTVAQPYHIELWCEKTTINDILLSLDEQYGGLNMITGEGELSLTACVQVGARRRNGLPICGSDSISRVVFTCGGFTMRSCRSASPSSWRKASITKTRSSAGRGFAWRPGTLVIWSWCPPTGGATRRAPRSSTWSSRRPPKSPWRRVNCRP